MTCTVCRHSKRPDIEALLAQGVSLRAIEAQFGVSDNALHRHKTNCIPEMVASAKVGTEEFSAESLVRVLKDVRERAFEIYERNVGVDDAIALKALQRVDNTVQTSTRIVQVIQQKLNANGGQTVAEILNAARKRLRNGTQSPEQEAEIEAEVQRRMAERTSASENTEPVVPITHRLTTSSKPADVLEAEFVDVPQTSQR